MIRENVLKKVVLYAKKQMNLKQKMKENMMKLTDRIHMLPIDFEITLSPEKKLSRFVNIILIFGERVTLIDTGVKGSERIIFDYINEQGRKIDEIESIILSHSHPDHIGSAAKIKEMAHCKIIAHKLEKEWIENIIEQNKQRPVPGFFNLVDRPVKPDTLIENDNQEIKLQEDLTLRLIKSSGHSKGSMNILFVEDKILFTADSVPLKNDIPNYDNYIELMKSLEKIKRNKEYETLLTSWTPALTEKSVIEKVISEGEEYMKNIDLVVKDCYKHGTGDNLGSCKLSVEKLGLPAFFVNPIVDKAFRSHFEWTRKKGFSRSANY